VFGPLMAIGLCLVVALSFLLLSENASRRPTPPPDRIAAADPSLAQPAPPPAATLPAATTAMSPPVNATAGQPSPDPSTLASQMPVGPAAAGAVAESAPPAVEPNPSAIQPPNAVAQSAPPAVEPNPPVIHPPNAVTQSAPSVVKPSPPNEVAQSDPPAVEPAPPAPRLPHARAQSVPSSARSLSAADETAGLPARQTRASLRPVPLPPPRTGPSGISATVPAPIHIDVPDSVRIIDPKSFSVAGMTYQLTSLEGLGVRGDCGGGGAGAPGCQSGPMHALKEAIVGVSLLCTPTNPGRKRLLVVHCVREDATR
jgi:hypothetical protein